MYLLPEIGFDTAEKEPSKVTFIYFLFPKILKYKYKLNLAD